jgi:DNA-binding NarL/FixJ family response regulator
MDCVETGYVLLPIGIRAALQGDTAASCAAFAEAAAIGERFGERDLVTLARQGQGRALIRMGQVDRGVALLDEVMVAVTAGELSASVVGDVYCSVIDACHELYDLRRAHEWTAALTRWCADQPEVAPYRGQCMLHRAEILQLHGDWMDALDEAERARERLSQPPPRRSVGAAFYRLGELHRLRGQLDQAEALYRQGSELGRDPHPGLALLRLAQGKIEAAAASSRRVVAEGRNPRTRAAELGAHVDIMLAAGDVAAARAAAEELGTIAARLSSPYLQATASQALGAVLLAEGDPRSALASLRRAATGWLELGAPYERARVHALIGLAHRALGDGDTAAMELDAAAKALRALGATPDANRVDALARTDSAGKGAEPLTAREVQVIQLVATGRTNRAIAEALGISEKTVARHLSNIFTKLGLSSRAAATAYAYQHRLLRPPT